MPYGIVGSYPVAAAQIFGRTHIGYSSGLSVIANPFLCCGVTALNGFGQIRLTTFAEKAEFLSGLFGVNRGKTHFVYILTEAQAKVTQVEHALLAELGSVKVCEFNSMQHAPWNLLQVFVFDINAAIGVYISASGAPLPTPSEQSLVHKPATLDPTRKPTVRVTPPEAAPAAAAKAAAVKKAVVKKDVFE